MSFEDYYKQALADAEALEADNKALFQRTLTQWSIRWTIGFTLIALTTRLKPNLSWLWLAGAGVASLSLILNLFGKRVVQERLVQIRGKAAALDLAGADGGEAS